MSQQNPSSPNLATTVSLVASAVSLACSLYLSYRLLYCRETPRGTPGTTSATQGGAAAPPQRKLPKRLILVRHGESEGNVDKSLYETRPDNALHLTQKGWLQAESAGRGIKHLVGDESCFFLVSPYVRTRETFHAISKAFEGGWRALQWHEDPRIREQDFGNFQNVDELASQKRESKHFGSFYYRYEGGESSADGL